VLFAFDPSASSITSTDHSSSAFAATSSRLIAFPEHVYIGSISRALIAAVISLRDQPRRAVASAMLTYG
jgi:hypothetical protein